MADCKGPIFEFGPFRLDAVQKTLSRDTGDIRLPPKTLELLIYFVSNPNQIIPKPTLMKEVWPGTFVEEANLSVHVSTLRKALAAGSGQEGDEKVVSIETFPKVGYRFSADVVRILTPPEASAEIQAAEGPFPKKPAARYAPSLSAILLGVAVFALLALMVFTRPAFSPKPISEHKEAVEFYERGMQIRVRAGNENLKLALESYTKAYTLDPNFASAYVAAAEMYEVLANNGAVDPADAHPKAIAAITRALEIDPQLAEAYRVLSVIKTNEWEWREAEDAIIKAIEVGPLSATSRRQQALLLAYQGRFDAAIEAVRQAVAAEPMNLRVKQTEGVILVFAGRYDEALRVFNNIAGLEPNSLVDFEFGYIKAVRGDYDGAIVHFRKVLEGREEHPLTDCYLGYALARSGRRDEADELLNKLKTSGRYVSSANLAFFYIGFEDRATALDLLEKAFSEGDLRLKYLRVERIYDSISSEPRFQELVRKVGLADEAS